MDDKRLSFTSKGRRSSYRGYGSVNHGSFTGYDADTESLPNSILERRASSVHAYGNTDSNPSPMPSLVGSTHQNVYFIPDRSPVSTRKWLVCGYILLYMASFVATQSIFLQYVYKRVQKEMYPGLHFNHTDVCFTNKSDPNYKKQSQVQTKVSSWNMYYNLAVCVPAIFANAILGSASDKYGRKFLFYLPLFGALIRIAICTVGIYYDFNLYIFLIGFVIEGFTGFIGSVLQISFTFIADLTSPKGKQRAFHITIIELFNGFGTSLVGFATGYFIQDTGFFYPMLAGGIAIALDIFIVIFIPESFPREQRNTTEDVTDKVSHMFSMFFGAGNKGRRWMYNVAMVVFLLSIYASLGRGAIETLYLLDDPFCWTPEKIGIYNTVKNVAQNLLGMALFRGFQICMSDEAIAMFSCLSFITNFVIEGIAKTDLLMYIGAVLGGFGPLVIPVSRALMSKLTAPEQQGAVFSAIAVVETSVSVISSIVGNEVYTATIDLYRGFVFFVFAACSVVSFILMGVYRFGSRRTFPIPLDVRY